MDLTPANIRALRTTLSNDFRTAYEETEVFYPRLATTVPSKSKQNDYGWMAALPDMREWVGDRVVHNLITHGYVIENKLWELTVGVSRDDIEDDNLGVYSDVMGAAGEAARHKPDQLITDLMQNGHALLCFDGQNYFDTDHPVALHDASKGTYSNYDASGRALNSTNFLIVRARAMSRKNDAGRSLKVIPDLVVVPPALEGAAIVTFVNETDASGASNTTKGMADILVVPDLAGQDTTWYSAMTSRRIKPFIFQTRRDLSFQAKNKIDDEVVLEENEVRWYADARYNAGYSLPFLMDKMVE